MRRVAKATRATTQQQKPLRKRQTGSRLRQRGNGCHSVFIGLGAVVLLAGFMLLMVTRMATQAARDVEIGDVRQTATPDPAAGEGASTAAGTSLDPFNVLLLGVDSRDNPEDGARSDTLIVVHVEPEEKWASMLSIPRDSVAQIPHLGQQKINAAYTYGYKNAVSIYGPDTEPSEAGAALAAETVEDFLNIDIDYMAQVDFRGFERVVDTMQGMTIDVPQPLLDPEYPTEDFGYERIYIPAGLQVLDGRTALRYARSRHSGSDFDRSCRQQRVLRAMLREVRERNILDQITLVPELVEDVQESVATTMPISDLNFLRSLAEVAQSLSPERILQFSINPDNVQVLAEGDALSPSNIYWNEDDIELLVERMLAGPVDQTEEVAMVQVQNGAGVRGLATQVTRNLSGQGFTMVEAADAPGSYENTIIIDYSGHPETRQSLADALGIEPAFVQTQPDSDAPPAPYNTDIVLVLGADYQDSWAMVIENDQAPPPVPVSAEPAEDVPNLPPGCSPDF
jgi:LCP family protein required for cell wall assembly